MRRGGAFRWFPCKMLKLKISCWSTSDRYSSNSSSSSNIDNTTPTPTCLYHRNQWIHTTTIRYINKPTRNLNTKQPIIVYIIYPSWSNKVAWCHCLSDHYVYTCSNHIDSSSELDHSVTLDISRLLRPMFVYCYSFLFYLFSQLMQTENEKYRRLNSKRGQQESSNREALTGQDTTPMWIGWRVQETWSGENAIEGYGLCGPASHPKRWTRMEFQYANLLRQ